MALRAWMWLLGGHLSLQAVQFAVFLKQKQRSMPMQPAQAPHCV